MGHLDADLVDEDGQALRRDCPTLTSYGLTVIFQVIASLDFRLWSADATTAFMQGGHHNRKHRLFLRPPREGFPGLVPGQLMELHVLVYGFADAPRRWWRRFRQAALDAGYLQCSLDIAVFVAYAGGRLVAIAGVHVDDVVGGDDGKKGAEYRKKLEDAFVWGDWSYNEIGFCGRRVRRIAGGRVTVDQTVFASQLKPPVVPRHRAVTPDAVLTAEETSTHRSGIGSMRWLGGPPNTASNGPYTFGKLGQLHRFIC